MSTAVNAVNRAVLLLFALLLVAAGVLGLVLSFGGFGSDAAAGSVIPLQARTFPASHSWFWSAVAAACVLVALLALWWLLSQLSTDRVTRLDVTTDDSEGRTTVHAGALTDAVEAEATAIRGVAGASAHMAGAQAPRLSLSVNLTDYADLADVRRQLEEQTVPHARQAMDDPNLPVDIELRAEKSRASGRGLT